ncbi:MAG: glutamine-hydrolyzing carbamoyl-phosphate synthase small subunit [Phycisphaerales bacterium]
MSRSAPTTPLIPARLALEDGTIFHGTAFGATQQPMTVGGEVVFNTAMTGYQEALTDPSYAGQILTMTSPMIGNYGVALEDVESERPQVKGFIVRELARLHSNYRAHMDLSAWLAQSNVLAIEGIDTRALVRRLRIGGAMRGVLSTETALADAALVEQARALPQMAGANLACSVSVPSASAWQLGDLGEWASDIDAQNTQRLRVVAIDCGGKRAIYRNFAQRQCDVEIVPNATSADAIRALNPDGIFISNGPGDPDAVADTIATLRELMNDGVPMFGICLGHQLLALAMGATTYKLPFGHRGANQPVQNLVTGKVEITSQNHGFCVEKDSLEKAGLEVTHIHLNDGTVAGFRHRSLPIFAVQYHPEASPGPHDSAYLFDLFVQVMGAEQHV